MNTKILPILVSFLLIPGLAMAQQGTVAGTVADAETGETLPGASVQIPAEGTGTATNAQGEFSFRVEEGQYQLRVSFVGYQATTRTINVTAGSTTRLNIQLTPSAAELGEVVVTGLAQQQTRAEASIGVSSIDAADLADNASFQSVEQLFQGSTPGLRVSKSSGNVGSGIRFNLRGNTSLNSDGQPLIFIDGTRINQDEVVGFGAGGQGASPLADLNPNNIASINVLKGPSAAALYGTDGADGVVLIETKSGRQGQELQVDYSGTIGYQDAARKYDSDTYVTADAANNTFRQGDIDEHQVSLSGSFNDVNWFTSFANRQTDGIQNNVAGERNNAQANFSLQATDELEVEGNTGFVINEYERPQNDNNLAGLLGNTLLVPVTYNFRDSTEINSIEDRSRIQRFTGSVNTTYTPEYLDGLRVQAKVGADVSSRRQDVTFPVGLATSFPAITDGERNIFNREVRQYNGDLTGTYDYDITDELSGTSTLGTQVFTESFRESSLVAQQFGSRKVTDIGTGSDLRNVGEDLGNQRSAGIFARQQFQYQNRYSVDFSLRRDYSTQLRATGTDAFTAWYPSVRGNVRLSQFDFAPDALSLLKVRGAFGQSGSLPDVTDTQKLRIGGERGGYGTGGVVNSAGDPNLKPERITEFEGGVDIGVSERYSLSATYYFQSTSESIVDFDPAPSTGLGNFQLPRNVGEVQGQGLETSLDLTLLQQENYRVNFSANHTYQTSEVKDLGGGLIQGGFERNVIKEGLPPGAFFGFKVDGADFVENAQGEEVYNGPNVVDVNGNGEQDPDDRVQLGNPNPDHYGGFSLSVQLFDLRISGRAEYQLGHQVYNGTKRFATRFGNNPTRNRLDAEVLGAAPGAGVNPDEVRDLEPGTEEYRQAANRLAELQTPDELSASNFLEDADFLKVREIGVSYDFTGLANRFLESDNLPVRQFRVRLSGRNLFTFTEYSGPDPEVNQTGSRTITQNTDFLTLQTPRTFTASINVGF